MLLANPLRIFPARLIFPKVQANCRWIAVNCNDRKAYILNGKDVTPKLLLNFSVGISRSDESIKLIDQLSIPQFWEQTVIDSYIDWYRQLNYNYPFVDYSATDSLNRDAKLMLSYHQKSPPPPPNTVREGKSLSLSDGSILLSMQPNGISLDFISGLLRISCGIKERVYSLNGAPIRKTSPSGGGRHPTDIGIIVSTETENLLNGFWWYQPETHSLIASKTTHPISSQLPTNSMAFVVSSNVERAMWRYRDSRSFRPVVIDAGHVIETLDILLQASGWFTAWLNFPAWPNSVDPFSEPEFGVLVATKKEFKIKFQETDTYLNDSISANKNLITNPSICLIPTNSGLHADVFFPIYNGLKLSPNQIDILTYCMPSTRGDRPSTFEDLIKKFKTSSQEIEILINSHALLLNYHGWNSWSSANLWSKHDWHVSLIAHCYSCSQKTFTITTSKSKWNFGSNVQKSLDARYTCRTFLGAPLPKLVWDRIQEVLKNSLPANVKISVLKPMNELQIGNYDLNANGKISKFSNSANDSIMQLIAIGQPWISGLSIVIWLLPKGENDAWELKMLNLGRAAQRIALAVSDIENTGIFQTPAIIDSELVRLLNLEKTVDEVYFLGIGISGANKNPSRNYLFYPSNIIN